MTDRAPVSRSTTIIGPSPTGQWKSTLAGMDGGAVSAELPSSNCRASCSIRERRGPARNPKKRMRTKPQCMQQEAAQKLVRGDRHLAFLVAVRVVLPSKGDRLAIKRNQPVIGDGHSMRVPGQILQQVMGAAERGFGIDNPFLLTNRPQEGKK